MSRGRGLAGNEDSAGRLVDVNTSSTAADLATRAAAVDAIVSKVAELESRASATAIGAAGVAREDASIAAVNKSLLSARNTDKLTLDQSGIAESGKSARGEEGKGKGLHDDR
jgi:hypothetical protein